LQAHAGISPGKDITSDILTNLSACLLFASLQFFADVEIFCKFAFRFHTYNS